jgi:methionyl-tRNA formyltransferase
VKTVFFGTPAIGVQALHALAETTQLVGVVCQPDRPAGRGMQLSPCPIKTTALELGVEVYQPTRVRDGALRDWLASKAPDVAVVFAYGRILPSDVLRTPRLGCINLHASLLPKLRGAAPIQWSIARGETETGISLMLMDEGLDTGPVFTRRVVSIDARCTGGELTERLANLAVTVIREDLPIVESGASPDAQDAALATHAPPIQKEDLTLHFDQPAVTLEQRIRAFAPAPGAFCYAGSKRLKVLAAAVVSAASEASSAPKAGTVIAAQGELLWVQTGDGVLALTQAQLEGKRVMNARDLVNGRAVSQGVMLTPHPS